MNLRFLILVCILLLLYVYTVFKISQLINRPKWLAWLVSLLLVLVAIGWQAIYRWDPSVIRLSWFPFYTFGSAVVLGFWSTFLLFSLPIDCIKLVFIGIRKFSPSAPPAEVSRRAFLARGLPSGLLGLSGLGSFFGFREAIAGPRIQQVSVPISDLPESLQEFKIVQISDLHVGPSIDRSYVENLVLKVNSLNPDLIAITGDLVDGIPEILASSLEPLKQLRAAQGIYYVTGNHEYYWGIEVWLKAIQALGFIPLLNENQVIHFKGVSILVAGVTDTSGENYLISHQSSPHKAAATLSQCSLKILLAHRPNSCFEAEPLGFDLQLSGHTHAGQFFPWSLLVRLAHRYYQGLNRHGRMWVYVNSGTGYWGPVNRLSVPAEITLIQLKRS